ncbi:Small nuclear ribonucleoprotein Sm D1 [Balamuthia mandrillaris]
MEGKKPIVAKARRIPEPVIIMHLGGEGTTHTTELCCRECSHLSDFAQPLAAGALLKTIILYMGIVDLASSLPLQQQLKQNIGGGLEIACATDLPQGSGLGTSSILAGAALRAVEMAVGRNSGKEGSKGERKTLDSLVDAVILVEQMLTTGGGWQDQVGGLFPGIKYTTSPAKLPLEVNVDVLEVPSTFLELLNQHLLLIYTGRTRLARGLLQDVLRRWHARLPDIVSLTDELLANANDMRAAILASDLPRFGRCLSRYWQQKKGMAGGVEPPMVTQMIERVREHSWGWALTGAGGGGFFVLVTKQANAVLTIQKALADLPDAHILTFHQVEVDGEGLVATVQ